MTRGFGPVGSDRLTLPRLPRSGEGLGSGRTWPQHPCRKGIPTLDQYGFPCAGLAALDAFTTQIGWPVC